MRARVWLLGMMGVLGCDADHTGRKLDDLQIAPGPQFPGAGKSGSANSIAAGKAALGCDMPLPFGTAPSSHATMQCFYSADDRTTPAATVEWIVESNASADLVHVRLTLNPSFCDNTYGDNAIGWDSKDPMMPAPRMDMKMDMKAPPVDMKKPMPPKMGAHTFRDLVGSDHAEFKLSDATGALRLHFKADYLSEDQTAPSGYATLGVRGGEGKLLAGDAADVVAVSTSLDRNLNACGLRDFFEDSPATDALYTPNSAAPNWDYRVVYDVWVRKSAFGSAGFGKASVDFVHASPSKRGGATVEVTPDDCPPTWPPACEDPDDCCFVADGSCYNGPPVSEPPTCTEDCIVGF